MWGEKKFFHWVLILMSLLDSHLHKWSSSKIVVNTINFISTTNALTNFIICGNDLISMCFNIILLLWKTFPNDRYYLLCVFQFRWRYWNSSVISFFLFIFKNFSLSSCYVEKCERHGNCSNDNIISWYVEMILKSW